MSRKVWFFLLVPAPLLALGLAWLGFKTGQHNLLGWVLFVTGLAFMFLGPLYFWRTKGGQAVDREERGDLSFWLILPGFLAVFFGSPLEFLYLPEGLPRPPGMQIAGFILVILGVALRVWARRAIRELYSGHVEVKASHRLVQEGPYRYIRHPGYAGFLLMTLGISLGYSSLVGLAAVVILLLPGLAYRMRVEEKLLAEHFGEEYSRYQSRTHRLIPGLW